MAKGIRPARCYKWDSPAYTRFANNPQDSFITGIPGSKIIHYDMGNPKGSFDTVISAVPVERIIVRHNALESARITAQKKLEAGVGVANYHFKVNVYPHHVIRENVMATGAGADRVQDGMRKSFGRPTGRAARVKKGQPILSVYIMKEEQRVIKVKAALRMAAAKLPGTMKIVTKQR